MGKFDAVINSLVLKQYKKVKCDQINRSIDSLIKSSEKPSKYLAELEKLAATLKKAFKGLGRPEAALRDDFLCTYIRIYALLGKEKNVQSDIQGIENGSITGINKDFCSKKTYNYCKSAQKIIRDNKRWRAAVISYKGGDAGDESKKGSKKSGKKGFFAKLFGI